MSKEKRFLKVYEQSGYRYKPTPMLMLKGAWLEDWGFTANKLVTVQCEEGKLIIVLDEERGKILEEEQIYIEEETKKFHTQLIAERRRRYGK
ncbi:SymE family type I addiction module toxin [Robinsoniella peoriensis]|uniref:SymE family type I addiction module toxin n=1 Tax=Robinsoniella peoriensis TaxID=180332 RepID=UPI0005C7BE7E|nr:SymE family type I addiction module toxin [Robinsoniella peoriensis]